MRFDLPRREPLTAPFGCQGNLNALVLPPLAVEPASGIGAIIHAVPDLLVERPCPDGGKQGGSGNGLPRLGVRLPGVDLGVLAGIDRPEFVELRIDADFGCFEIELIFWGLG
ncbi:hypothetical protein [Gluconobacter oxydans]|uniref:hypothetical protein n=1 Tax=Gluconobacter oxydans TaxID=442 RepID=UPI001CD89AA5|nr:hypothetical protein [Gluconobacter oxydans]